MLHLVFPSATLSGAIRLQLSNTGERPKTAVLKVRCSLVTKRLHRWRVLRRPGCKPPGAERLLPTAFH